MRTQDILKDSILYYPSIEFLDDTWVKSALCVWETIYRNVPLAYTPRDSDEVKRAIDVGLIRNIVLSKEDLSETAQQFGEFWVEAPVKPAGLIVGNDADVRLHPEKADARILPILQSLARHIDPDGWLKLSPEVANAYMLFLAETVSRRRRIAKLTDNPDMFAIMHYFANDGNIGEFVYDREAREVSTVLVLETLLPGGLQSMSMQEVLAFRRQFAEGRQAFRSTVISLIDEISRIEDENFRKDRIRVFEDEFRHSQRKILDGIGQTVGDAACAALSVGLPTTMTAIGVLTGGNDPFSLTSVGKATLVGVVSALADAVRSRRKRWNSSEATYYMQLHRRFKPEEGVSLVLPAFDRIMEEFIND